MSECIAGQTYTFRISVRDSADPTVAKNNPTIGASDFLISINDGTDTALTNTPTVISSSRVIKVILSAAETTAAGANGSIVLKVADASASDGWLGGDIEIKVRAYATATSNDVTTITNALTTIDDFIDTEIAAIKAKTDNLPSDPADASDIAASFTTLTNKLTAYVQLLARKDAGIATTNATEVTAINAGGGTFSNQTDSVEALRDRGDVAWITATGFATAAELNSALADFALIPAASANATNVAGALAVTKASTFEATLTGIIAPSGWTKAYFTVKADGTITSADSTAVIQIVVTNGGNAGDGLLYLNGASTTLTRGSLAINTGDNEAAIVLADDATATLLTGNYTYDIKFLYSTSKSGYVYQGTLTVGATPTQTYNTA